ncbi:MAG: hypothetical protein MUO19_01790 [Dehalococcoidales bacterium]|nr:hypothetical protein [Dehalococcoidales bacterium]
MSERKYEKYIITENIRTAAPPPGFLRRREEQKKLGNYTEETDMFRLDDSIIPGAFYIDCHWMWEKHGTGGLQTEISHSHDFDEVLGFIAGNRENPRQLNGEIEFWLEDEQYIIDYACLIYVPAGMNHLPLIFRRIDSPIFFFTAGTSTDYTRSSGEDI